jgi:hypothetical protein
MGNERREHPMLRMYADRVIREDRGAAETSTIFAWIVVGVLVVMGLLAGLQALGADVIGWVRTQLGM